MSASRSLGDPELIALVVGRRVRRQVDAALERINGKNRSQRLCHSNDGGDERTRETLRQFNRIASTVGGHDA